MTVQFSGSDGGTNKKTRGQTGDGRGKDVQIFTGSDQNAQD